MTAAQKTAARQEITGMLEWCLTKGLPDASVSGAAADILDGYYFAVRFLDRAGFWDPAKRFWLRRQPDLSAGVVSPHDLAQRLAADFAALHDTSGRRRHGARFVARRGVYFGTDGCLIEGGPRPEPAGARSAVGASRPLRVAPAKVR